MKTKYKEKQKRKTPISLIRGAVGQKQSKTLRNALETFKSKGAIEKFPAVYMQSVSNKNFAEIFPPGRKAIDLGRLGIAKPMQLASLGREIQWAAVSSYFSRILLNAFFPLRTKFIKEICKSEFEKASETLNQIGDACGESLWVLENRIALISQAEGFEAQKKFVQQITKDRGRSNISFMATAIGERNEPRVTAAAFYQRLAMRSKAWKIEESQKSHIFYRLTNSIENREYAFSAVLAHEGTYSCVDLYETLLDVIRRSHTQTFGDQASCIAAIDYLRDLQDERLASLRRQVHQNGEYKLNELPQYHQTFKSGDYKSAVLEAEKALQEEPWNFDVIVMLSKIASMGETINIGSGWLDKLLTENFTSVFSAADDAGTAADSLQKISTNLRHLDFSAAITALLDTRTYQGIGQIKNIRLTVNPPNETPYSLFESVTGERRAQTNINKVSKQEDRRVNGNITADYLSIAKMYSCLETQNFKEAETYAEELEHSENIYFRVLGKNYHNNLLAKLLDIELALENSVKEVIQNPEIIAFTPLLEIIKGRSFRNLKTMASNPCLAAAFYIYMELTERTDKEVALKVAWKHFLKSRGVDRPSLLIPSTGESFSEIEVFFLYEVCRQETMELGGAFSSQIDLDKERMQICVNLTKIDPENVEIYDKEIVDLTRRINLEEGVEFLESSRVFVDEIGIQKWAKKNLESQYLRYVDYHDAGLFLAVKELEEILIKIASTSKNKKTAFTNYLDDYDISADTLLVGVLRELGIAFMQLPRFGLDAFLSSRVRHGSFVGYLRGPLEHRRIVTKKSDDGQKYLDNDYLLAKWEIYGEREKKLVNSKLAVLSETIDTILEDVVSKYLHVNSNTHLEGMIKLATDLEQNSPIFKRWLILLKAQLTESSSLEFIVSYSFQHFFWPSVKISLDALQTYVQSDLENSMSAALDSFINSVFSHLNPLQRREIIEDFSLVKTELHTALKRVALWFDLPKSNPQMLSMSLERALEIGLISTKNARPDFNPDVKWHFDPQTNFEVNGLAIGHINDMAFLAFANISKHSGFEEQAPPLNSPCVDVYVYFTNEARDEISIKVVSDISPGKGLESVKQGIGEARGKIDRREFESISKQKKGTGLVRMAMNLQTSESFDDEKVQFGLDENSRFFVNLRIPKGVIEMVKEREDG